MVVIQCPIPGCGYATPEVSESIAIALLTTHTTQHTAPAPVASEISKGPRLDRPKVEMGVTPEEWNIFTRRWDAFVHGSGLNADNCSSQLFQCAGPALGDCLLKSYPNIVTRPTVEVLAAMKSLAVVVIAIGVARAELVTMRQSRDEPIRAFASRVRGKAETCAYVTQCTCALSVDFTDCIIKDVILAGISDLDIRREVLSMASILEKSVNDIISLIESKEMARNAMPHSNSAISSFKRQQRHVAPKSSNENNVPDTSSSAQCAECNKSFSPFVRTSRGLNSKPYRYCPTCHKKRRSSTKYQHHVNEVSEQVEVGGTFLHISGVSAERSSKNNRNQPTKHSQAVAHHIFTKGEWRRSKSMQHPRIPITISVDESDYHAFKRPCPHVSSQTLMAIADSGAQSCLWSFREFLEAGFKESDLIPVSLDLMAANKSPIPIEGAVLLRLAGAPCDTEDVTCACMVYVSKAAKGLYLSMESLVDLGILSKNFPEFGPANDLGQVSSNHNESSSPAVISLNPELKKPCSCPCRTAPPMRPTSLPFECSEDNNEKMEKWLIDRFSSSTFNTCPHQSLPSMSGPPVEIHLKDGVTPTAVHKPSPIPIHWQDQVYSDLLRDEALGVIEKVPYGEPVQWCHRMVVTRKHDGTPRRTVDLSPLNKHCQRETFANDSPFHLARRLPKGTWKTVCDAWNGYHSVPLRESDRHLTTFITPFGRWRYKRAPQGFVSSGDGYNRRFDAILSDFLRHERCVDDIIHYDEDLEAHWWRTIDLLVALNQAGIVLNPKKFCFAKKDVNFAGFRITNEVIEPLPKYLDAIRQFPAPKSTTDVRSWFGLVNQVSHYAQLREIMTPFKPFLSPRHPFSWNADLEEAFQSSKTAIVNAIRQGVSIFDPLKPTCLRPDWSCRGIGYFLSQKHCQCSSSEPDCCADGWRVTLAGSRFLSSAEQRYAPVEGEALAVAWGLEQCKYFTLGCPDLLVITDHRPLIKILGDRTLDEITNTRLFRIKQRTLPWSFRIIHRPGKTNSAADATSRHPCNQDVDETLLSSGDILEIRHLESITSDLTSTLSISWDEIVKATDQDPELSVLREHLQNGRPCPSESIKYSSVWEQMFISEGALIFNDRVVVPSTLRQRALEILHSAHQGTSRMEARARSLVYWPGINQDIQAIRNNCSKCNQNAPSLAKPTHIPSRIPSVPFECIFCDFFEFSGHHYLVAGDRFSGWIEIFSAPHGTAHAGSKGLQAALRTLFATFGVPVELSSDGGPEFSATSTTEFLRNWGIKHRKSSAHFPQSNGRAEVAVKKAKRLLMNNISATGCLDNDKFLRALLQTRNTPDQDSNLSPAQILFGRNLRDAFGFINRCPVFDNRAVDEKWRLMWASKENAMTRRAKLISSSLNAHSRPVAPLRIGDRVFVQNQFGNAPNKWDKVGTVTNIGSNDQYTIKILGSNRVTTRNRRFLRKVPVGKDIVSIPKLNHMHTPHGPSVSIIPTHLPTVPIINTPPSTVQEPNPVDDAADAGEATLTTDNAPSPDNLPDAANLHLPIANEEEEPTTHSTAQCTRPKRDRKVPRVYEPETGHWVDQ